MNVFFRMILVGVAMVISQALTFGLVDWIAEEFFNKKVSSLVGIAVWILIFATMSAITW